MGTQTPTPSSKNMLLQFEALSIAERKKDRWKNNYETYQSWWSNSTHKYNSYVLLYSTMGNGIFPWAITKISRTEEAVASPVESKPILVLPRSCEAREAILGYWKGKEGKRTGKEKRKMWKERSCICKNWLQGRDGGWESEHWLSCSIMPLNICRLNHDNISK